MWLDVRRLVQKYTKQIIILNVICTINVQKKKLKISNKCQNYLTILFLLKLIIVLLLINVGTTFLILLIF